MSKDKEMTDYIQIGDKYRVTSDGRQNLMLHEEFEKTEGRGAKAKGTGEFEYRHIGYFRQLKHIGSYLVRLEEFKNVGEGLDVTVEAIEKLEKNIVEAMENIDVTWAKPKK